MKKFVTGLVALSALATGLALAADVGPKADVAAVRAYSNQKNPGQGLLGVHVVGNYALTDWYKGEASGYGVYKRVSGETWKQLDWGGGAITVDLLAKDGMPTSTAHQLCSGWGDSSPC